MVLAGSFVRSRNSARRFSKILRQGPIVLKFLVQNFRGGPWKLFEFLQKSFGNLLVNLGSKMSRYWRFSKRKISLMYMRATFLLYELTIAQPFCKVCSCLLNHFAKWGAILETKMRKEQLFWNMEQILEKSAFISRRFLLVGRCSITPSSKTFPLSIFF